MKERKNEKTKEKRKQGRHAKIRRGGTKEIKTETTNKQTTKEKGKRERKQEINNGIQKERIIPN